MSAPVVTIILASGDDETLASMLIEGSPAVSSTPTVSFPTVCGRGAQSAASAAAPEWYVGEEALMHGRRTVRPMRGGHVSDWDAMERVWRHALRNELCVDSSSTPRILLVEPPLTPPVSRERAVSLLVDTFKASHFCAIPSPVACIVATGKTSGVVIEVGSFMTFVTSVVNGQVVFAHKISGVGGSGADSDGDGDGDAGGNEKSAASLHELVHASIVACTAADMQAELCKNIVFSGSNSMIPGLGDRLAKELRLLLLASDMQQEVNVIQQINMNMARHLAWNGGQTLVSLASLNAFEEMWVSAAQFAQRGPSAAHAKRYEALFFR